MEARAKMPEGLGRISGGSKGLVLVGKERGETTHHGIGGKERGKRGGRKMISGERI